MNPTLILVRHGETEGESSIRYHGRTDVALSELGRQQMRAARRAIIERVGERIFDHVFASPLSRAAEGARIIAGDTARLEIIEDFVEVHFGLFEGLTAEEIRERHPDHYARWNVDPLAATYTYPEGESRGDFVERVERGLAQMLTLWGAAEEKPQLSLLVAHRGVIRTIVHKLTGRQPVVELGSIQSVEFDGTWRATLLDVTDHLLQL